MHGLMKYSWVIEGNHFQKKPVAIEILLLALALQTVITQRLIYDY